MCLYMVRDHVLKQSALGIGIGHGENHRPSGLVKGFKKFAQLPRCLLDPLGPVRIRPSDFPALVPWFWRFWRDGKMQKVRRRNRRKRRRLKAARKRVQQARMLDAHLAPVPNNRHLVIVISNPLVSRLVNRPAPLSVKKSSNCVKS